MKPRNMYSIILKYVIAIIVVNLLVNVGAYIYLQGLTRWQAYNECTRISNDVKNEIDRRMDNVRNISMKVQREILLTSYFENEEGSNRRKAEQTIQESVDLVNDLGPDRSHVMIIDSDTGTMKNFSRQLSQTQMEWLWDKGASVREKEYSKNYIMSHFIDDGDSFWLLGVLPYMEHDYQLCENKEKGVIFTCMQITKADIYSEYGFPQSISIFIEESGQDNIIDATPKDFAKLLVNHDRKITVTRQINQNDITWYLNCNLYIDGMMSLFGEVHLVILILLVINILLLLSLTRWMRRHLSRPLKKIIASLKETSLDSWKSITDVFTCNELNVIAFHFNHLYGKLEEELKRTFYTQQKLFEMELCEKDRNMKALISQVNPHFIYNMLENIRVLADLGRTKDVSLVSVKTAAFLRYSLYVDGFVTLEEEINIASTYLDIMKILYNDMFEVETNVDGELMGIKVPKMIIQPVIGNIFKHGFLFDKGKNIIRIEGKRIDDHVEVRIYDNGTGMEDAQLRKLNEELSETGFVQKNNGFGLYSVNQRLRTIYGEEYCVKVKSEKNSYTEVIISLPIDMDSGVGEK